MGRIYLPLGNLQEYVPLKGVGVSRATINFRPENTGYALPAF
jgi:hypothetical protein